MRCIDTITSLFLSKWYMKINTEAATIRLKCLVLFLTIFTLHPQARAGKDSSLLIAMNQRIDHFVVEQNVAALDSMYARDFVFSHGSGKIEGKQGWLNSVARGGFIARQHDSVTVEMHPAVGILRGKLSVQKKNAKGIDKYHLKYVRIYALRERRWVLISHITTHEYHEIPRG